MHPGAGHHRDARARRGGPRRAHRCAGRQDALRRGAACGLPRTRVGRPRAADDRRTSAHRHAPDDRTDFRSPAPAGRSVRLPLAVAGRTVVRLPLAVPSRTVVRLPLAGSRRDVRTTSARRRGAGRSYGFRSPAPAGRPYDFRSPSRAGRSYGFRSLEPAGRSYDFRSPSRAGRSYDFRSPSRAGRSYGFRSPAPAGRPYDFRSPSREPPYDGRSPPRDAPAGGLRSPSRPVRAYPLRSPPDRGAPSRFGAPLRAPPLAAPPPRVPWSRWGRSPPAASCVESLTIIPSCVESSWTQPYCGRLRSGPLTKNGHPSSGGHSSMNVRRCPTLPQGRPCSTIGAASLSFRVRNVSGRFPRAMAAETLATPARTKRVGGWVCGLVGHTRPVTRCGSPCGLGVVFCVELRSGFPSVGNHRVDASNPGPLTRPFDE